MRSIRLVRERSLLRSFPRSINAAAALPFLVLFFVDAVGLVSRDKLDLALVLVAGGAAALAAALVRERVLRAGADALTDARAAALRCLRRRRFDGRETLGGGAVGFGCSILPTLGTAVVYCCAKFWNAFVTDLV